MMSRQPFITEDLRPDLAVQPDSVQSTLTGHATTEQLADAALALLSDEERQQVERGSRDKHRRIHTVRATTQSQCAGNDSRWRNRAPRPQFRPLLHPQSGGNSDLGTLHRQSVSPKHPRGTLHAIRSLVGTHCRRSSRSRDAFGSRGTLNTGKEVKRNGTSAEGILYRAGWSRMNCCATSQGRSIGRSNQRKAGLRA